MPLPKHRRFALLALVVFGMTSTLPLGRAAEDPVDLVERVADFRSSFSGAATTTRTRQLAALRDDLSDRSATFEGEITSLSSYTLPPVESTTGNRATVALTWEYEGLKAPPVVCRGTTPPECAARSALRLRTVLPEGDTATLVIVQRGQLMVYALTQDDALVDSLRRNTEVSISGKVQGMFEYTIFTVLESARVISLELACSGGHSFPADSGFTFCPKCGRPLQSSD